MTFFCPSPLVPAADDLPPLLLPVSLGYFHTPKKEELPEEELEPLALLQLGFAVGGGGGGEGEGVAGGEGDRALLPPPPPPPPPEIEEE